MPGSNNPGYGNLIYDFVAAPTSVPGTAAGTLAWSAATVGANTTAELTTTIPGALPGDIIDLYLVSAAMTTGLTIANTRVATANTLSVTWINSTGGAVTVPTTIWNASIARPAGALPPTFV